MKKFQLAVISAALLLFIACGKTDNNKTPVSEPQKQTVQNSSNSGSNQDAGKYNIRLNLKKGETYYLKMLTEQKISQSLNNQKISTNQTIGVSYSFKVESIANDGTMNVKVTYNSFLQDMQSGQMRMTYNSNDPKDKDNPLAKLYSSMINKSFTVLMLPDGSVKEVKGIDALLKEVIKNMDLPDPRMKAVAEKSLSEQFSDKAVSETMQSLVGFYPPNPVKKGDSWTKTKEVKKGFPASFETSWTLKEVKGNDVNIDVFGKIKGLKTKEAESGLNPKYNLNGEQNGTIGINLQTGWITKAQLYQKFSGKIELEKSEMNPKAISVPVSIESIITIQAVK